MAKAFPETPRPSRNRPAVAIYRVLLGLLLVWQSFITRRLLAQALPVESHSSLRFHYPGLPLAPLPLSPARQADVSAILQAGLGIAFMSGKWTRIAALGSLIVLTHTLLLEVSLYQNHYWLLFNVLVCFVAAGHRPDTLQALLRFVHSLPYAFGAVAKLSVDWLVRQQPATRWCADIRASGLSRHFLASPWCPTVLSVGGLMIDAAMVPLLCLPPPYRAVAHFLALSFHVSNAALFHIGIFPFVMLSSHVLWMDPSRQPFVRPPATPQLADNSHARRADLGLSTARRRRPMQGQTAEAEPTAEATTTRMIPGDPGVHAWCIVFVLFHLAWPIRRWVLYNSASLWSQEGYFGAWQMKQTQLDGLALLVFSDAATDSLELLMGQAGLATEQPIAVLAPQLDPDLTPHQRAFVAARPHMLLQYAQHRAALLRMREAGRQSHLTARAVSCFSLNNRPPQPLYRADRGLPPVAEYEWLGVSGTGVWLHPLRDPQTTLGPSAECTALLQRPQALLRSVRAGFHQLRIAVAHHAGEVANETDAHHRESAQSAVMSAVYWHHVGALRHLVDELVL